MSARNRGHLYIAVRCFDATPHGILAPSLQRDASFDSDDLVRIALDSFHRERDGYLFIVNPAGAQADAIFARFGVSDFNWDTIWTARTRIDDRGWTARISVFSTRASAADGGFPATPTPWSAIPTKRAGATRRLASERRLASVAPCRRERKLRIPARATRPPLAHARGYA